MTEHRADGTPAGAPRTWTRRRVMACAAGGVLAALGGGAELVAHGVLPGKQAFEELAGSCAVPSVPESFVAAGPTLTGRFDSAARGRSVGYTIAYPPGHRVGDRLALAVMLHGFGGDHTSGFGALSLAQALAGRVHGEALKPFALVAVDGGGLYWNTRPGDDPMAMLVGELLPRCRRLGLGAAPHRVGVIGISMGGYGALLLAEKHPALVSAAAAISPAVWTTYAQARAANAGAFASAAAFADDDVIAHAPALAGRPVRIASGTADPFHPGVLALGRALPRSARLILTPGCHDGAFFASQAHASLSFVGRHLVEA